MLQLAHPFGKSSPYHLEVNGRVVGLDHRKGMSNDGNSGIMIEAFEVLPRRLAPFDDGVQTRWPAVGAEELPPGRRSRAPV